MISKKYLGLLLSITIVLLAVRLLSISLQKKKRTMKPFHDHAAELARENADYRRVLYTTNHSQLVLMSLKEGQEIPQEKHPVDQFFSIVQGQGQVITDTEIISLSEGSTLIIPAGTIHTIKNRGSGPLKLFTLYAPPEHPVETVHKTQEDDPEM